MDIEPAAGIIAAHVTAHLEANEVDRRTIRSAAPPPRPVEVVLSTWEAWLRDGGTPDSTAQLGPIDETRLPAINDATKRMTASATDRLVVDRETLLDLSVKAARSSERSCTALFIATMMWGSGTANGRGPWRTAQALRSDVLGEALTTSHRRLRDGDLIGAFVTAHAIPGCGEPYFTRWLWAASLALPPIDPQPLILDDRRRHTISSILCAAEADDCMIGRGLNAYTDYVTALGLASTALRRNGMRHISPEKIEWVLSERSDAPRRNQ